MTDHNHAVQQMIRYPPSNNSLLNSGNTKNTVAYEPRTEAISPAINDDIIAAEESAAKSTKDEQTLLVDKLKKVEAEIIQTDQQIVRLRKQKAQLERAQSCAFKDDDNSENVCDTKQLSIAKLVYHENRAKAQKAHAKLESIAGSNRDLPIYNQPSDNAIYYFNTAKFTNSFKNLLIKHFKQQLRTRLKLEETVSTEYNRRMEKWLKSIELDDSQPSNRIRDAKTREFFEKQFPELKKARESGERFSRVGQRVARSDAEFDELLDGIAEREDQDKKVKSYAVIPPMLEEMRSMKPKFINTNGHVEDIVVDYNEYLECTYSTWTEEEKVIFKENYLQHPKNFGLIAAMTGRKSVANCVQYYYMSKKTENYKQLLKRQQKRRTRSFVRPAQQTPVVPSNDSSTDTSDRAFGFNNDKQTDENVSADVDEQNSIEPSENQGALLDSTNCKKTLTSDSDETRVKLENVEPAATCCVCNCELSDGHRFRNVTRSNHQFYGIALDTLKPGMRICYACRFRHVKHPGFDEPSISPEIYEEESELHKMKVDPPAMPLVEMDTEAFERLTNVSAGSESPPRLVIDELDQAQQAQQLTQPQQQSGPSPNAPGDSTEGPQRLSCVRDIIYQAIEMSFQKPMNNEPADLRPKLEPFQSPVPECVPVNLMAMPQQPHVMPGIPPIKPPMGSSQNINATDHRQHQLQAQIQLEYNIRRQHLLAQQQHQNQMAQQQAPPPPPPPPPPPHQLHHLPQQQLHQSPNQMAQQAPPPPLHRLPPVPSRGRRWV